jgi:poly-gamma-glutamate capsule biosynthesis protein CapA/YwtB (metallophosphatase superfamily)
MHPEEKLHATMLERNLDTRWRPMEVDVQAITSEQDIVIAGAHTHGDLQHVRVKRA